MTLFLRLSKRYSSALETFDPFPDDWFMRLVDPRSPAGDHADPAWGRVALAALFLFGPIVVCSAIPVDAIGGHLRGAGGLVEDIGFYGIVLFASSTLVLIVVARRILGALINDLVAYGIVKPSFRQFRPARSEAGRLLRILEHVSRSNRQTALLWLFVLLVNGIWSFRNDLLDGKPTWTTWYTASMAARSQLEPMRTLAERPNLAGVWFFLVASPILGYLVILACRLFVVFGCLCADLARREDLTIAPCHPDNTGGLKPIGQVALFLSIFTFVVGIDLGSLTVNQFVRITEFGNNGPEALGTLHSLYALWLLYATLGSLLFFLPLLPLRARMADAKRAYIIEAWGMHAVGVAEHERDIRSQAFRPDHLQGLVALDGLIANASDMIVWPFDRKTFVRYSSLLLAPVSSLVYERAPAIFEWIRLTLTHA